MNVWFFRDSFFLFFLPIFILFKKYVSSIAISNVLVNKYKFIKKSRTDFGYFFLEIGRNNIDQNSMIEQN